MATKKKEKSYTASMKEALLKFDLKELKSWMRVYNNSLYRQFRIYPEEVQMGTMCKMICNRTDLFNTEAHKKAIAWLKEHNMKGRLF